MPLRDPPLTKLSAHSPGCTLSGHRLRCPVGSRGGVPGRHSGRGPLPLPLSLVCQARIPVYICLSGRWPVGAFPSEFVLWGKEKPGLPVLRQKRTWGRCWAGQGTAPPPAAWRSPSCPGYATAEVGRSPGPRLDPGRPEGWRCDSPLGRAPAKPKNWQVVSPGATRPNLFVHSAPARRQLPSLRRRAGPPFAPEWEGSPWPLPLHHIIPRGGRIVRLLRGAQERLLRRDP